MPDAPDQILAGFEPFTSKDTDIFLRDHELAFVVATAAGWKFRAYPEPGPRCSEPS